MTLKRTQDRKTANLPTKNGKQSKIANAFSLPAGRDFSCPGATDFCNSICYAGKLEKLYKGFREVVLHNFNALKDLSAAGMYDELFVMIDAFRAECDKWNAPKTFRIHADGDFFNSAYYIAWGAVVSANPDIHFWAYTRVEDAALYLHGCNLDNLSLYFSADPENIHVAKSLKAFGINIAMVAKTFAEGKDEFPKATRCPEQTKALPLITENGGACITCGLCVKGRKDVLFSVTKK